MTRLNDNERSHQFPPALFDELNNQVSQFSTSVSGKPYQNDACRFSLTDKNEPTEILIFSD